MDWSRAHLEARLAAYRATDPWDVLGHRRAAVAVVLRFTRGAPDVLLMQRATREGDRWSGHVSFPGGRAEPADADLAATAVRETREELGLDLSTHARPVGRLDGLRAIAHGKPLSMTITPFVFVLERAADLTLSDEAVASFWLPLDRAATGELDAHHPYRAGPLTASLPCWRWEEHVVWGLTFEMLRGLVRLVADAR